MLEVKYNYKNKFKKTGLVCRACKKEQETQNHILNECPILHKTNATKVYKQDFFSEGAISNLSETAKNIIRTMDDFEKMIKPKDKNETQLGLTI